MAFLKVIIAVGHANSFESYYGGGYISKGITGKIMKILFEHNEKVPVKNYGGTERILIWLMKELVLFGHKVYLVGHKESEVRNLGVTLIPKSKGEEDIRQLIPKDVDIIHLFSSPKFEFEKPLIVTCHGNGQVGEKFHRNTVFLSKKHAENHNSKAYVYNGIDLEEYPFGERKKNNWKDFLFLAKASWKVKNLNHCLKACKNQKKQLHIAGGWKLTFSSFIHSYGLVNQVQKIQLLKKCDALLWPVRWHEPFGIAVIEAMAMGLPVISSSYGSLPELLSPETGILCKNYEDFERAISVMPKNYDSLELRDYVSQKFSSKIMVNNYLKLYEKVLNKEFLNLQEPRYLSTENPQKLLDF